MLNRATLIGRLGQNIEFRKTAAGTSVAAFSIATNEAWTDKSGQKQERTEWHKIVAFGKLADVCHQYLSKGSLVFVDGKIVTKRYQDKTGVRRHSTIIQAQEVRFLSGAEAKGKEREQQSSQPQEDFEQFDWQGESPF
jgi:single-strand DNA-binding protein